MEPPLPGSIRRAELSDASIIAELGQRTFRATYAAQTRPEDIDAFLADAYREKDIRAELSDPRHRYFVAEVGGVASGFAQVVLDEPWPGAVAEHPALLAHLYLVRAAQGAGLGASLMRRAIEESRGAGADILWLGVWENNARAIEFYRRWGFEATGEIPFDLGSDRQRDIVMELRL